MLPQIESYHASLEAAEVAYNKAIDELDKQYRAEEISLGIYDVLTDEQRNLKQVRENTAWNLLGHDSDELIAWIVNNCDNYRSYANVVLAALPLDVDGLRQLRLDEGWCSDYNRYLENALNAGVVSEPGVSRERRKVVTWVTKRSHFYDSDRQKLNELLVAYAAAEVAAAKEQWENDQALTEQATDAENAAAEQEQNL